MNRFSISQLEQFSGIKAHTIRIWEARYKALTPLRSKGNTRYYDNSQLRRLLNITSLLNSGYKVSELCSMQDHEMFQLLQKEMETGKAAEVLHSYFISQLITAAVSYDTGHFEKMFSSMILRFGLVNSYTQILYPLFERLGLMWANNTLLPTQEHFISNLVRQKLFSAIDELPPAKETSKTWLLFLPENEFHEIGLLFSCYLLRHAGRNVVYLGSNVPMDALENTVETIHPDHLLLFLVHNNESESAHQYLTELSDKFPKLQIAVAGNVALFRTLLKPENVKLLHSPAELLQ